VIAGAGPCPSSRQPEDPSGWIEAVMAAIGPSSAASDERVRRAQPCLTNADEETALQLASDAPVTAVAAGTGAPSRRASIADSSRAREVAISRIGPSTASAMPAPPALGTNDPVETPR